LGRGKKKRKKKTSLEEAYGYGGTQWKMTKASRARIREY
jgi:hypothetical protein